MRVGIVQRRVKLTQADYVNKSSLSCYETINLGNSSTEISSLTPQASNQKMNHRSLLYFSH